MPPVPRGDRGFELLEHTADVGLRVWAPDLGGMFAEAARALIAVMGKGVGAVTRSESVTLESTDLEALFVDWLSEVLFLFEARDVVAQKVEVAVSTDPCRLRAVIEGPSAEDFVEDGPAVKAVTYHRVSVQPSDAGWEATVYLDV